MSKRVIIVLIVLVFQVQLAAAYFDGKTDGNSANTCQGMNEKIGAYTSSVCQSTGYDDPLCTRVRRNAYDLAGWCDRHGGVCYRRMKKYLDNPKFLPRIGAITFMFDLGFDSRNPVWSAECTYPSS